jgi:hypothetical protein
MIIVEDLQNASVDVSTLQDYIATNFEQIYDLFENTIHSQLLENRTKLNRYIQLNRGVISQLDIRGKFSLSFISLLLDISEELGLISSFRYLFDLLRGNNYNIGERLHAASLYLINVRTADDYLYRYEAIYEHLQHSVETEEDNTDKVLMTIVNYYSQVIHDFGEFNIDAINALKAKIHKSLIDFEFSFLHSKLIEDVLKVEVSNFTIAYRTIHSLLDSFLGRDIIKPSYKKEFLLETGTIYCKLLANVQSRFKDVRQISVNQYQQIKSDSIYNSLGRGVTILTDESQLFAYMNSYGNMHYEKLIDAFKTLPNSFFQQEINIIDWGCGQAMASMTYFDFINQNTNTQVINKLTLIEPSEIALKRASLHIGKFDTAVEIHTVNKDLDGLVNKDFGNEKTNTHVHLFSNILDIDKFSLTHLLKIVETCFLGDNYFICVSPYINDTRTSRLDAFVNFFSKKPNFKIIQSVDNSVGEWKGSWTRVVRVFKVSL